MINFLHSFHPSSILFQIGIVKIHGYGFLVVSAIIIGLFIALKLAQKYGYSADDVYDLAFYLVIFSAIGARIYAVLLFPKYYFQNPLEIFQPWKGGLAIHGVIFAGLITLFFYTKRKKLQFWAWADILVVALAFGQAVGRWGNYFNQENFGKPTTLPWGIPVDFALRPGGFENFEFFHPTFLYESILNFALFLILLSLHFKKLTTYNLQLTTGIISLLYLIFYSIIRICMEFIRIDETPLIFGIRFPILVSAGIMLISLLIFIYRSRINSRHI